MEINEPVAWISKHGVVYPFDAKDEVNPINELQPLFTAPPKRKWVGLTDDQILGAVSRIGTSNSDVNPRQMFGDARAIEAKLKELNT